MADFLAFLVVQDKWLSHGHFDRTSRRLYRTIRFAFGVFALVKDSESQWEQLVIVAKLVHEKLVRLPLWLRLVVRSVCLPYLHPVVRVIGCVLTGALNLQPRIIREEAEESF